MPEEPGTNLRRENQSSIAQTPPAGALRHAEAPPESPWGTNTSSGEHAKLGPVRCPHCTEAHPPTYSHCPRSGKPLQTGPALVGRVIAGRYRVTGILGEGGMGAVYIAEHLALGRKVAIKRLHPELTGDEKAVARFQREARAAAATGHEHIVEVLDLGYAEDGAPYLVMEYLRGTALAQVIKQEGRLPLPRTANIIGQVLAALSAVHQREIVHRDLKPDNVFLTRRGGVVDYVKVLDFGISKMKHEEGEPTNLTRTGVTMGTPYYMSPEQARGIKKLDHRVDLYAVSVMLYECLTGRLPLTGDNYHALLQQILRVEPLPPSTVVASLPPALDALILKGLAKDPAQRFSSATEMLEALVPFGARMGDVTAMLSTHPVATQPVQPLSFAPRSESSSDKIDARAPTEYASSSNRSEIAPPSTAREIASALRESPTRETAPTREPTTLPTAVPTPLATGSARESAAGVRRPPEPVARARPSALQPALPSLPTSNPPSTPGTPFEPRARPSVPARPSLVASVKGATPAANGPRYFFAASDDWVGAGERVARSSAAGSPPHGHVAPLPSATPLSPLPPASATTTGPSLPRVPPSGERTIGDISAAARESAPRPIRDEIAVKGALVVALLDHLESELGSAESASTLAAMDPSSRQKLDGVILPMAWLPLALFESLLAAMDRDQPDAVRSIACGRAAAERELATTHRLFLQTATPVTVLDRLPHLHRVYFSRGEARVTALPNGTRVDLEGLGAEGVPLVSWLSGFWQRMLELAGARDVKVVATTSRGRGEERSSVTLRWR